MKNEIVEQCKDLSIEELKEVLLFMSFIKLKNKMSIDQYGQINLRLH